MTTATGYRAERWRCPIAGRGLSSRSAAQWRYCSARARSSSVRLEIRWPCSTRVARTSMIARLQALRGVHPAGLRPGCGLREAGGPAVSRSWLRPRSRGAPQTGVDSQRQRPRRDSMRAPRCRRRLQADPGPSDWDCPLPDAGRALSVENWAEIRRLHRAEAVPIKEIARRLGVARNIVRSRCGRRVRCRGSVCVGDRWRMRSSRRCGCCCGSSRGCRRR